VEKGCRRDKRIPPPLDISKRSAAQISSPSHRCYAERSLSKDSRIIIVVSDYNTIIKGPRTFFSTCLSISLAHCSPDCSAIIFQLRSSNCSIEGFTCCRVQRAKPCKDLTAVLINILLNGLGRWKNCRYSRMSGYIRLWHDVGQKHMVVTVSCSCGRWEIEYDESECSTVFLYLSGYFRS